MKNCLPNKLQTKQDKSSDAEYMYKTLDYNSGQDISDIDDEQLLFKLVYTYELTPTEKKVLCYHLSGLSYNTLSEIFNVSRTCINNLVNQIIKKIKIKSSNGINYYLKKSKITP